MKLHHGFGTACLALPRTDQGQKEEGQSAAHHTKEEKQEKESSYNSWPRVTVTAGPRILIRPFVSMLRNSVPPRADAFGRGRESMRAHVCVCVCVRVSACLCEV